MSRFEELLRMYLQDYVTLTPEVVARLEQHYERLVAWNRRMSLTSLRSCEDMVRRHYCESIFFALQLPETICTLVDVGSGAGFPGFPIAVLRTSASVQLVESNARKCVFLRECARGIPNLAVFEGRAEGLPGRFDWVVARAVRPVKVVALGCRIGRHVGLLVGDADADELAGLRGIDWEKRIKIPGGDRRVILIGSVPRETR